MSKDLEQQFRKLFQNDYPGIEILREKLISPLWKDIGNPKINIDISENEKNKISQITIFANQGSEINFVDVELTDSVVLRNNRVTINKYIANHVVDIYQSALIFFHYKNTSREWRISYVYKGSGNSDTTNAKRYTYLCGSNLHCRTAAERFANLKKENGYPSSEKLIEAFSVEALTKEFFGQLFNWYEWACKVCKFPGENCIASNAELDDKNNRLNLIRLITRIMFVWFIKHKDLIPEWIFNKSELKNILSETDFDSETKGNYYNAVLQNLFFGALNKKIEERGFADKSEDGIPNQQYGIKTYFRDANEASFFKVPPKEIVNKFIGVPFLNGGLFECLDWDEPTKNNTSHKVHYVDGFSRNPERRAFVPNILFWNENEKQPGLITILSRYNFTVEESTPNDVQVALDPELLGKVFENLLGTYNPETRESARKESGSFYTPREIVSYMVNRSIMSYLQEKVPDVSEENLEKLTNDDKSDDSEVNLSEEQIHSIRKALFDIKIIDPACGSGAFPMGILNKLVEIHVLLDKLSARTKSDHNLYIKKGQFVNYTPNDNLKINAEYIGNQEFKLSVNGKIESNIYNSQDLALHVKEIINEYNKKLGKSTIANLFSQGRIDEGKSFNAIKTKQDIHQIVDEETHDIVWQYKSYNVENKFRQYRNEDQIPIPLESTDEDNDFEYAKYLYSLKKRIIQDSIYGVDIQPIAVQISKLRFFISLICEQPKTDSIEDNYGYNPLPNLETKFVAANTLIGLAKEEREFLDYSDDTITKLKNDLIDVRKLHFSAKTAAEKKVNRETDESLRQQIIEYLKKNSKEINQKKLHELKYRESNLSEQLKKFPVVMVSKNRGGEDLFGNIDDEQYDENEDARNKLLTDLKKLQKDIQLEIEQDNKTEIVEKLEKLVEWNPYNQSAEASSFFDSDWMFGVKDGFDIVIGNPPYGVSIKDTEKNKYRTNVIKSLGKVPDFEIYYYFIEESKQLLKISGILSFIIPNTWLFNTYAKNYRLLTLQVWNIVEILDCSKFKIFDATVNNSIIFFKKDLSINDEVTYRSTSKISSFCELINEPQVIITKKDLLEMNQNWALAFKLSPAIVKLIKKIKSNTNELQALFPEISQGLIAYDKYKGQTEEIIRNRIYHSSIYIDGWKKNLWGEDVTRYKLSWNEKEYINYCDGIANPRKPKFFTGKRILVREITNPTIFACITDEEYYNDPAILIILDSPNYSIFVLLGILNSKLATFYHFNNSPKATKGSFPKILIEDLKLFPLPEVSTNMEKKVTNLVQKIISIKEKNSNAKTNNDERMIDLLVYHLYGLSFEEAKIIDESLTEEEFMNNY